MSAIRIVRLTVAGLFAVIPVIRGQGVSIRVSVPDLPSGTVILSHRFGLKFYTDDTLATDPAGNATFRRDGRMPEGMYQLVMPDKKFAEFFLTADQDFTVSTRASAPADNLEFTGTPDNERFIGWQKAFTDYRIKTAAIQKQLRRKELSADSIGLLNRDLSDLQGRMEGLTDQAVSDLDGTLPGKFIDGLRPVKLPEFESVTDPKALQLKQYEHYRNHFFDRVDLTDDRLLRTPLIESKIDQYFKQVVPQIADTLIREADRVIALASPSPAVYQFVVQYLFNLYSDPEIMGTDAVYVHLADRYYLKGLTPWVDTANLRGIRYRAGELRPLLLGKPAPAIAGLVDSLGRPRDLESIRSEYLVLYFWSPDCGFCKEATPKLAAVYPDLRQRGAEVLAINTRIDREAWTNYLRSHPVSWENVYNPQKVRDMIETYQAFSTPVIYILDKDRKIIAKTIPVDQVLPFLIHHSGRK